MYNKEEILAQLDKCNTDSVFPMLDNGYCYLAATKLTAYRDEKRWAMIIETIGFSYRGGGHNGISNCLYVFGNFLDYEPGIHNKFIQFTDDAHDCNTFDDEEYFYLNPKCREFKLRETLITLSHDRIQYELSGIELDDKEKINAFEFLRLLNETHHDTLTATESEIRERIPKDIPLIIELDEWFHPDIVNDEKPSENETCQQLAELMETGNLSSYRPTKKPNTHWKNWPEGGTL